MIPLYQRNQIRDSLICDFNRAPIKQNDDLVLSVLMTDLGFILRPCTRSHKSAIRVVALPTHLSEEPFLCGKIP